MPDPEQHPLIGEYAQPKPVQGALGVFLLKQTMPIELVQQVWADGSGVPMDMLPPEFWRPPGYEHPRFGEEMLGSEF